MATKVKITREKKKRKSLQTEQSWMESAETACCMWPDKELFWKLEVSNLMYPTVLFYLLLTYGVRIGYAKTSTVHVQNKVAKYIV